MFFFFFSLQVRCFQLGFSSKQEEGNYLKTVKEQRAESFTAASAADGEEVEQRRGGEEEEEEVKGGEDDSNHLL